MKNKGQQKKYKVAVFLVSSILCFVLYLGMTGLLIVQKLEIFDVVSRYSLAFPVLIFFGISYLLYHREKMSESGFINNELIIDFQLKITVVNLFVALGVLVVTYLIFASQWEASNRSQREIVSTLQKQVELLNAINDKQK